VADVRACTQELMHPPHEWSSISGYHHCPGLPSDYSPAQRTMRTDMEQLEDRLMKQDPGLHRRLEDSVQLNIAVDAVLGEERDGSELSAYGAFQREVPGMALTIISAHPSLVMGLADWRVVQTMIEEGIVLGYDQRG